jgi:hypothetical protein
MEEITMPVPVGSSKVLVGEKMGLGRNWEKRKRVSGMGFDAEEMGGMKMVLGSAFMVVRSRGIWEREGREIWEGGGKNEKKPKTEGMLFCFYFFFFI